MHAAALVARSELRRRWRAYGAVALLLAITLGTALVAFAGARRTQSAYPRFLRSVHASTLSLASARGYDPRVDARIAALPEVARSRTYVGLSLGVLDHGRLDLSTQNIESIGTFDGRYFDQDRFTATTGRDADPKRRDEVAVNEIAARRFRLHAGQRLTVGVYSLAQISEPTFFAHPPAPMLRTRVTIVGVGLFPDEILQDDGDRATRLLVTPAFTRWARAYVSYSLQGLELRPGHADVDSFKRRVTGILPDVGTLEFRVTADDTFHAQHAMRPVSIALGAFGIILAIASLVLVAQALARLERTNREDQRVLRALGLSPRGIVAAVATGPVIAVAAGAALAVVFAFVCSPLMPIGPVRRVEVARGFDLDATVVVLGALTALVILVSFAFVYALLTVPNRRGPRRVRRPAPTPPIASSRIPVSATTGLRLAFGRSETRSDVATRSVALGGVIAVAALVGAVVFGVSLRTLVERPRLYGWEGDAAIVAAQGYGNLPLDRAHAILDREPAIAAWSGAFYGGASVNGRDVPLLGMPPDSRVIPVVVRGRTIRNASEIVLGETTARELHAQVGDAVTFAGEGPPVRMKVVGIATFPTIGPVHVAKTSLGIGALVVPERVPGFDRDITGNIGRGLGPRTIFVRFRRGVAETPELARLRSITQPLAGFAGVDVVPVQRPAEIVNASEMGAAPIALGAALAAGAAVSLGLALAASVRHQRRELTLLKTLGFTRRQVAATVAWNATATTVVAVLIGVPLGILAGRRLWTLFAHQLDVVAHPATPTAAVLAIVLGALVVANVVAAAPARAARNVPAATLLRSE